MKRLINAQEIKKKEVKKCSCTISGTILTFIRTTLYLSGQPGSRTIMLTKCDNVAPHCPLHCTFGWRGVLPNRD